MPIKEEAEAALAVIRTWVAEQGLTLHPDKTHIGDCREPQEGFEFLGYRFEAGQQCWNNAFFAAAGLFALYPATHPNGP